MRRILLSIIILFGFWNSVSAASFPFTDVSNSDTIYTHLTRMISVGWILDDGSGVFAGGSPASRDFFTALIYSSKCQSCLVPRKTDIQTYASAPYSDVTTGNPYYYCIARDKAIGYLGQKEDCTTGFCPTGWVTRIEAVKWLLRSANLWNDSKNPPDTIINIADISGTSVNYGYARKWLELWLIQKNTDWNILPDTIISRAEAVKMAAQVQSYTQCTPSFSDIIDTSTGPTLSVTWASNSYTLSIADISATSYRWSLGDGNIRTTTTPRVQHTYDGEWLYTVSVFAVRSDNTPVVAHTTVRATGILDTDKDGVYDDTDICPLVVWTSGNKWCPVVSTKRYGETIASLLAGITKSSNFTLLSGISTNSCLLKYQSNQGLIIAEPICDQCPCQNKVTILSELRSCDIIFPSVLSPDTSLIYSRGAFYQIP